MFIAWIVFTVLTVLAVVGWLLQWNKPYYDENLVYPLFFWILFVLGILSFCLSLNVDLSNQTLTGYIYSNEDRVGYTVAHIRFSQNAGTDEQPSFCVKDGTQAAQDIKRYSGSNIKVMVNIPAYAYFSNNPFACGSDVTTITKQGV